MQFNTGSAERALTLLDELEKFEKGLTGDMNVSAGAPPAPPGPRDRRAATRGDPPAGLKDPEDIFLTTWNVAIMGPPEHGLRPRYPSVPPENMRKLMPNWKYANTIADVLGEIRKNMASNANRRLNQPPEGANY
ncbi:hypothetical protein JL721_416 [Aureococcus anophagefferens]|nr:hypothetical protein JL721_416 [Aureococcus anophagefferens]